jgi:hypothetical protein
MHSPAGLILAVAIMNELIMIVQEIRQALNDCARTAGADDDHDGR